MTDRSTPIGILLLEDSELDAELVEEYLRRGDVPHSLKRVWTREGFVEAVENDEIDLIIADHRLPAFDGMSALEIAHERLPEVPFIFVSGTLGEEAAVESLKRGATDYVLKQRLVRLVPAIRRALAEAQEKKALRRAEEHQRLLINELNHRVKNSLATVQAIAYQTLRSPDVPEAPRRAFTDRLLALAKAHDILTEERWEGADIRDVVGGALDPYGGADHDRFEISGPAIRVSPRMSLSLAMALHELATNAAKYGALSVPGGKVHIDWSVSGFDGNRRIEITWREVGGPEVEEPSSTGFGSRLIERGVAGELQGTAELDYRASGVVCRISAPLVLPSAAAN